MPKRSGRPDSRLRAQLAERDGWRCCRCGGPIPRTAKYPHPLSLTLEHLVPLMHGGRSTPETCSVSHHRCNTRHGRSLQNQRTLKRTTLTL